MIDRQLLVSPEPPTTTGTVTTGTDAAYRCFVAFRGHEYQCYSAGKNTLIAGDLVSFWEIDGLFFCAKSSAGYPTRFKRPLVEWAATHAYNLFLQYCIRKQKNIFTYRIGVSLGAVDANTLAVACWDGIERNLPVEYAGVSKSSSPFVAGDAVALYRKSTGQYIVIGKLATITVAPDAIDFGNTPCVIGGDPVAVDVVQTGSTEPITATAPTHFLVSNGGAYGSLTTLPSAGGTLNIKMSATTKGAKTGAVSVVSSDASASVAVSGIGDPNIQRSPATLSFGNVVSGQSSTPQEITITGNGTVDGITVICSSGFEIGETSSGPWYATLNIAAAGDAVFCRFSPTAEGPATGVITISSPEDIETISMSGTGISSVIVRLVYPSGSWPPLHQTTVDISAPGTYVYGPVTATSTPPGTNVVNVTGSFAVYQSGYRVTCGVGPFPQVLESTGTKNISCSLWVGEGDPILGAVFPPQSTTITIEPL